MAAVAAPSARADDLVVLSAAALRSALLQVPPLFEKQTGHQVSVSFGNATAIQNKVTAGDRVDVVILPPKQVGELMQRGFLVAGSNTDLGVVRLGVAARAGASAGPVSTAEEFKQALLSAPSFGMPDPADGSTSSLYLVKLLQQLAIAGDMQAKTRLFPDGTRALHALARGEIALAVAPVTSIYSTPGVMLVGPLPEALQLKTVYAAALSRRAVASDPAHALLRTLKSPEAAAVFRDKGVDPP